MLLLISKKQKAGKTFIILSLILLGFYSFGSSANLLLKPLEKAFPPYPDGHATVVKFIVVLGGAHTSDPDLPITSQLSAGCIVRLVEGIRIQRRNIGSYLILSGGNLFTPISVAEIMARTARELGVKPESMIIEAQSKDTEAQAEQIKKIVKNEPFVMVTSAAHMPRAVALFKKSGLNPIPAPTHHLVKKQHWFGYKLYFPSVSNLVKSKSAIHEYLGILWSKLRGKI